MENGYTEVKFKSNMREGIDEIAAPGKAAPAALREVRRAARGTQWRGVDIYEEGSCDEKDEDVPEVAYLQKLSHWRTSETFYGVESSESEMFKADVNFEKASIVQTA